MATNTSWKQYQVCFCLGDRMKKILVIGGGFFGVYLSEYCARLGHSVRLIEKDTSLMSRASYNNQARVHNGYHYPRSILTALRSRLSFPRFVNEFKDCIDNEFSKYYLIGKILGKISAKQFVKFCELIGAPCEPAPSNIQKLVNPSLIEAGFSTIEFAFDAIKLRNLMIERLDNAGVICQLNCSAEKIAPRDNGLLVDVLNIAAKTTEKIYADHVFNCTYSHLNEVHRASQIEIVSLKHEMTEMCLVEVPDKIKKVGITVMCGPFFSVMPFPSAGLHSFSHVRYTPHYEWLDISGSIARHAQPITLTNCKRNSAWRYMQADAMRYMPILSECRYDRSLWEIKTVLPRSETDDSRPILFKPNHSIKGFHCIMGGKIDNVYDAIEAIDSAKLLT